MFLNKYFPKAELNLFSKNKCSENKNNEKV